VRDFFQNAEAKPLLSAYFIPTCRLTLTGTPRLPRAGGRCIRRYRRGQAGATAASVQAPPKRKLVSSRPTRAGPELFRHGGD